MILAARVKLGIDTFFDLAHMTHALDLLLCTRQGEVRRLHQFHLYGLKTAF